MVQIDGLNPRVGCFYDRSPPAMDATPVLDSPDMTREVSEGMYGIGCRRLRKP